MRRVQHGAHIRHAVDDVERVVRAVRAAQAEGALLLERQILRYQRLEKGHCAGTIRQHMKHFQVNHPAEVVHAQ